MRTISSGFIPILSAGLLSDFFLSIYLRRGYELVSAQLLAMINIFYLASILAIVGTIIFTTLNFFKKK